MQCVKWKSEARLGRVSKEPLRLSHPASKTPSLESGSGKCLWSLGQGAHSLVVWNVAAVK